MAVYSLLHLPSAFAAQALPGTLPYEARTFLPCFNHGDLHSSDRLAHFKGRMLANFYANCSNFFEQSVFYTCPSVALGSPHDQDRLEYNRLDKIMHTVADHDAQHIRYTNQDEFHR